MDLIFFLLFLEYIKTVIYIVLGKRIKKKDSFNQPQLYCGVDVVFINCCETCLDHFSPDYGGLSLTKLDIKTREGLKKRPNFGTSVCPQLVCRVCRVCRVCETSIKLICPHVAAFFSSTLEYFKTFLILMIRLQGNPGDIRK